MMPARLKRRNIKQILWDVHAISDMANCAKLLWVVWAVKDHWLSGYTSVHFHRGVASQGVHCQQTLENILLWFWPVRPPEVSSLITYFRSLFCLQFIDIQNALVQLRTFGNLCVNSKYKEIDMILHAI